jgi:hypothetical protein
VTDSVTWHLATSDGGPTTGGSGFSAHVNFQAPGATYPGYVADIGAPFGDRGNGFTYGWSGDNTSVAWTVGPRTRGDATSPDLRYDSLIHMGAFNWEIAVPNGTYTVHVVVGDPSYSDVVSKLTVEGSLTVDGSTSESAHWLQGSITVSVNDGKLTIGNLAGSYNKICFIDISSAGFVNPPPAVSAIRLDVGSSAPYTDSVGRLWQPDQFGTGGTLSSKPNAIGNTSDADLLRTYRFGNFSYDVPVANGTYDVYLRFIEPWWSGPGQRLFNVRAEGSMKLQNVDLYAEAGQFNAIEKAFSITVSDGVLNLDFITLVDNAIVSSIAIIKQP